MLALMGGFFIPDVFAGYFFLLTQPFKGYNGRLLTISMEFEDFFLVANIFYYKYWTEASFLASAK